MATRQEVIGYLRPNGGLAQSGDTYEGIQFFEAEPFTKEEYEAAFDIVDALKEEQKIKEEADKAEAKIKKQALLDKLGITEEEAKLLLS